MYLFIYRRFGCECTPEWEGPSCEIAREPTCYGVDCGHGQCVELFDGKRWIRIIKRQFIVLIMSIEIPINPTCYGVDCGHGQCVELFDGKRWIRAIKYQLILLIMSIEIRRNPKCQGVDTVNTSSCLTVRECTTFNRAK